MLLFFRWKSLKNQFKSWHCGFIAALHIKRVAAPLTTLAAVVGLGS